MGNNMPAAAFINGLMNGYYKANDQRIQRENWEVARARATAEAKILDHKLKSIEEQEKIIQGLEKIDPGLAALIRTNPKAAELYGVMKMLGQGGPGGGMPDQQVQTRQSEGPLQYPSGEGFSAAGPGLDLPGILASSRTQPQPMQTPGGAPSMPGTSSPASNPLVRGFMKKEYGAEGGTRTQFDKNTGEVYRYDVDFMQNEIPGSRTLVEVRATPEMEKEKRTSERLDKMQAQEQDLRKEYMTDAKKFIDTRDAYAVLGDFAESSSAAGDVAMIYKFITTLDPTSSVKEGEVAMAKDAKGVSDKILNYYNTAVNGTALTPAQRQDFLKQAQSIYDKQLKAQMQRQARYKDIARGYGLDPERVVTDYTKGVTGRPSVAPGLGPKPVLTPPALLYKKYNLTPPPR